ncbi:hypothetical protein Tco_0911680 [Tanacetum coccineum]|uniref:Uncharacterized protein n=1 Tax=Tanacetum coccineum TaxID=301880 RepID=A0ABQ5CXI8_9ASTR
MTTLPNALQEERSDWDDDERSGGKVLVIQERLAQNQQEFLDEYLPQWDEHLAIQKQELESERSKAWPDYQFRYPRGKEAYSALEAIADEPQNITSQVRQLILLEDPYCGSTGEQDRAYRDLDRITYEESKNLWSFLEDFKQLATKSGRLYFPSTTEKLFAKLPPSLSKKIEESFRTC